MWNKKIVVVYGNCHTTAFIEFLKSCDEFNEQYEVYPILPIQNVKDSSYFELPIWNECDVFIHQDIRKENPYGEEFSSQSIIKKLKPECLIIAIPNLYHLPKFLFPNYCEKAPIRIWNETMFFRDKVIDEGILSRRRLNEITQKYNKYHVDEKQVLYEYDNFIKKVEARQLNWDVKVADFLKNNISNYKLFYDVNHPTNYLIRYYAYKTLEIMLHSDVRMAENIPTKLDSYEMPILENVNKAMGIKYIEKEELRISGQKVRKGKMYISEYVKQYFSTVWASPGYRKELLTGSFGNKIWGGCVIIRSWMMFVFYKIYNKVIM